MCHDVNAELLGEQYDPCAVTQQAAPKLSVLKAENTSSLPKLTARGYLVTANFKGSERRDNNLGTVQLISVPPPQGPLQHQREDCALCPSTILSLSCLF